MLHMTFAGFSMAILCLFGLIIIFGLLSSIFWIWMLIDCVTKEPDADNSKWAWTIIIVLLHFVGALIYYFARRPERMAMYGR